MQVVHELLPSFPFALPLAVRTFLYLQGSARTFSSQLSGVYNPVRGLYTMPGTHRWVS